MISTELSTRILLTVIIVGALAFDLSTATSSKMSVLTTKDDKNNMSVKPKDQRSLSKDGSLVSSSIDSPVSPPPASLSSTISYKVNEEASGRNYEEVVLEDPETRLMPDSAEAGILLPYDDDFPQPGGGRQDGARLFSGNYGMSDLPSSMDFPTKPIALRVASGKALEQPYLDKQSGKGQTESDKATYYLRNNCFGPRCNQQQGSSEKVLINSPEEWKDVYYGNKEIQSKKFESRSNAGAATNKYEDNVLASMSSNFHSQLAIPFVVVDDNSMKGSSSASFSKRNGLGRFSQTSSSSTTNDPVSTEGWIKLKAMSPESYDPFRFSRNQTGDAVSTFNNRDSSSQPTNNFSKRVGVELNPESFADRWGWSDNGENDNRGGSRLPAWLEEQLKYGNRNTDQGKDWVKLEPIPVAGVSISKWVPKGTPSQDLPTTSWQADRDRPNGGSQWWDRIDENRILNGNRFTPFLRPTSNAGVNGNRFPSGGGNRYPSSGGGNNRYTDGGWGSKGSSLSSFDRYPTNSWNDIIYPDGPSSATVSWQQDKGISNYPSSFGVTDSPGGWTSGGGGGGDTRKPIVATGSWSAPPNTNSRFPSFINRFNDHRSSSSYPVKQASEDDPRWVLISNSRRVTSASPNRGNDQFDRSKVLSYINRLHPDLDRRNDFPFFEPGPTSHRNGKGIWPYPSQGSTFHVLSQSKDVAFQRLNATLSSLTPMILHRGGSTVSPPIEDTLQTSSSEPFSSIFDEDIFSGDVSSEDDDSKTSLINSISSTLSPLLSSSYIGDGRATSIKYNAANLQQSSTSTPVRISIPGKIKQGLKNINPVYAAVGAGMIPATLAAVMPMMLGKRRRRNAINLTRSPQRLLYYRNLPRALNTGAAKYLSIANRGAY